jgi:hypothetical protein
MVALDVVDNVPRVRGASPLGAGAFVVDTGAIGTLLADDGPPPEQLAPPGSLASLSEGMGITYGVPLPVDPSDPKSQVWTADVADFRVFGLDLRGFHFLDGPLFGNQDVAGLLGADILSHYVVALDYQGKRAELFDYCPDRGVDWPGIEAGPPTAVPIRLTENGRILVEASVDGAPPVTMMVDTGSPIVVIDRILADGLKLPGMGQGSIAAERGPVDVSWVLAYRLAAGNVATPPLEAAAVSSTSDLLADLSSEAHERVWGLLGGSFLSRFAVTIDYPGKRLLLQPYYRPSDDPGAGPQTARSGHDGKPRNRAS